MRRGFLYLVAIMDGPAVKFCPGGCPTPWTADFCVAALEDALARYGKPEIFNTDQAASSPATSSLARFKDADIRISMDGQRSLDGQCHDREALALFEV